MPQTFFFCLIALSLMAGCSSLDKRPIIEESYKAPLGPLQLTIKPDFYFLRADLIRGIHSETTSPNPKQGIVLVNKVENPYHVIGIGLGNDIILDLAGNLYFDLGPLLGIQDGKDFSFTAKGAGVLPSEISYVRRGAQFKRTIHSLVPVTDAVVVYNGNVVTIRQSLVHTLEQSLLRNHQHNLWHSNCDVTIEPDGLLYDPHGLAGMGKMRVSKDASGAIAIPGFFSDRTFKMEGENKAILDGTLEVTRCDDRIEIVRPDLFGSKRKMTFIRTKDGIMFDGGHLVEVKQTDKGIEIYRDKSRLITYEQQ